MNKEFKRKRIRIKDFNYMGSYVYFITICTFDKQIYFKDAEIVGKLLCNLKQEADRFFCSIYAYCFMPDHLHLLLIGDEEANLMKCIKIFKQKSGYYFKQRFGKQLWQRSFFDHVLRKRKYINDVAGYIFENPVRKKLVDDFRKYPYQGSFVIDLNAFYDSYALRRKVDLNFILNK
ncbi:MAG: transposase [Candidatus Margulisiibacteriota bacterium]